MKVSDTEFQLKGKIYRVPAITLRERTVIVTGKWPKLGTVQDEELVQGDVVPEPSKFLSELKTSKCRPDILTFPQKLYHPEPTLNYYHELDNVAAANTTSFLTWWEKLPQESRKNARRAAKRGVVIRSAALDEDFVLGIKGIYDETPVRQGMKFWHYGKSLEQIKKENGTYAERSEFIGAYVNNELIGFLKFVCVDKEARIMQILAKNAHYDKRPMNALIAKAVEVCEAKGMSYLIYSKLRFGNKKTSTLAEFKLRNGFEEMQFPRYFVPLTLPGQFALKLKLHRGLLGLLPFGMINFLLRARASALAAKSKLLTNRRAFSKLSPDCGVVAE